MNPSTRRSDLRASAANPPITLDNQALGFFLKALLALTIPVLGATASAPPAAAQTVTYTGAAVNFGAANVCPSGKTTPAPCSKILTLTYNITESGTLGTPEALTAGAPDLDYKLAGGSTCAGSVTKGNTCAVNVAFAPTVPGARNGAVEIVDDSGHALVTTYIYGTGIGPRITFSQPAQSTINVPSGDFAADGNGNLFVASTNSADELVVEELLAVDGRVPANPVVKLLASEYLGIFPGVTGMAVDGAGNLFFMPTTYLGSIGEGGTVQELLAAEGYATFTPRGGSFDVLNPVAIAVDGSANVFVSAGGGDGIGGLYEIPAAGGYATFKTLGGGYQLDPWGIALDASGNLFAANATVHSQIGDVLELTPNDGYTSVKTINISDGQNGPYSVAIDAAGNLFTTFTNLEEFFAVDGVLPAIPASRTFGQFSGSPSFDSRGNLYLYKGTALQEIQLSTPSTLSFAQTIVGKTSTDSPQPVEIQNEGNAPLDLTGLSLDSPNWDIVKGSGTPEDCSASTTLASGALCNLSISFEPKELGPLAAAVTFTDNALNAPAANQTIPLSGIGDAVTPPNIISLNTTYGAPYSVVTVAGTNFGAGRGSSTVTFNGIAAPTYYWSNTHILATVPPNATTGNLVVTVGGLASNAVPFTVLPMPVVAGISPSSGPVGTVVTISGTNLIDYENKGTVTYNGQSLPILSETGTAIKVAIPTGSTTISGYFHVVVNDTGINSPAFTLTGTVMPGLVQVQLASVVNTIGIFIDGTVLNSGGLDRLGSSYSAKLMANSITVGTTPFAFGAPNQADVVTGTGNVVIPLPAGSFSTFTSLGTAVDGPQTSQVFTVTYSDGSSTQFTQSLSDWAFPANYPGRLSWRPILTGTSPMAPLTTLVQCISFSTLSR